MAKKSLSPKRVTNSRRATKSARKPAASTRRASSSRRPSSTKQAATGISLHLGLNAVNPSAYAGWSGPLGACEFDAEDMAAITKAQGLSSTILLTKEATRAKVLNAIRAASRKLVGGDLFVLTYSGHGGQVDDVSGEEADKLDETWCLFDGQLIDDELYLELSKFAKGVRVLVLSDSCHSGTVTRAMPNFSTEPGLRPRMMPPDVAQRVYLSHKKFYDGLQRQVQRAAAGAARLDPDAALAQVAVSGRLTKVAAKCKAAVLLISGCQDNQTSMDGLKNGAFTEQLLKVWDAGKYRGNYAKFHSAIKSKLPPTQSPNFFTLGPATAFAQQQPFTV